VIDLQVAYKDTGGTWYGEQGCSGAGCAMSAFNPASISLIRVTLVTRSEDKAGTPQYCRPAAEDRSGDALGSASCGYIYRKSTFTVQPRNILNTPN